MAKFKVSLSTKYVGSKVEDEIEIEDEELEGMSTNERETYIEDVVREWVYDEIDWGWVEVNGE